MYLQNPIFNKVNINQTILLSIIVHVILLINLQSNTVKFLPDPEIEINLQEKK